MAQISTGAIDRKQWAAAEKHRNSTHIINITSQSFNYFVNVSVSAYCFSLQSVWTKDLSS